MRRVALVSLLLVCLSPLALGEPTHDRKRRVAHIVGALAALQAIDGDALTNARNYFYVMERNKCQSAFTSLRVSCMIEAAKQSCAQKSEKDRESCSLVADIIIMNRLSEKRFISTRERYKIMKEHQNYKEVLLAELRHRYAALATELHMSQPKGPTSGENLASSIDAYCLGVAGARELSWQSCTAAVVWFIGTSKK